MDVKTAFLQSFPWKRDVFLKLPKEYASPGYVWKLKKCVCGPEDASRKWKERVTFEFKAIGLKQAREVSCVFFKIDSDLTGIIRSHVDDFWIR